MTHTLTATTTSAARRPGGPDADPQQTGARMELLQALPVRLQQSDLDAILALSEQDKTSRSISWRLSLDPLVVELELLRHQERQALQRPLTEEQQQTADAEAVMPRLDRVEMNRLARGTHIPNVQLRQMIAATLASRPGLSVHAVLRIVGYKSTSHGRRQLGYMRHSGSARVPQTIRPADAARVVRALGQDPVDVVGL